MLDLIHTHATIIQGGDYNAFKIELEKKGLRYLSFDYNVENINKKDVNVKMEDLDEMKDYQSSKSSVVRYIITNKSIRNTVVQNAMLKLLEEPGEGVHIVMFTTDTSMILPTVLSRCQLIILDSDKNKGIVQKLIANKNDKTRFARLERYLRIDNLHKRGLVSDGQLEDYKGML